MSKPKLVRNAIQTPDGTIIESLHTHDYVLHTDKNGEEYMVDGGLSYLRRNVTKEPYIELSVYDNDSHEKIREGLHWGTYGKNGDQPLQYKPLKDLDNEHIKALLVYLKFPEWRKIHLKNELIYRGVA